MNSIGYTKPLFILPFDHRSSFTKGLFGIEGRELTSEETQRVTEAKTIVYESLKKAIANGVPREDTALLVDEEYGSSILEDAKKEGIATILTTEKSGQEEFEFEYGDKFQEHLEQFKPTFVKALVRYNPEGDKRINHNQLEKLKVLSDYCHSHAFKFLIEPLIPATKKQLEEVNNNGEQYDDVIRPQLEVEMMEQMQRAGVEPDVWKIEGMDYARDYFKVSEQAQSGGKTNVGIVVLGRAAEKDEVEKWLTAGIGVPGVIGFAVGRTIFWKPLEDWRDEKITRDEAIDQISKHYEEYCQLFLNAFKK